MNYLAIGIFVLLLSQVSNANLLESCLDLNLNCNDLVDQNLSTSEIKELLPFLFFDFGNLSHEKLLNWNRNLEFNFPPYGVQDFNSDIIKNAWVKIISVSPSIYNSNSGVLLVDSNISVVTAYNYKIETKDNCSNYKVKTESIEIYLDENNVSGKLYFSPASFLDLIAVLNLEIHSICERPKIYRLSISDSVKIQTINKNFSLSLLSSDLNYLNELTLDQNYSFPQNLYFDFSDKKLEIQNVLFDSAYSDEIYPVLQFTQNPVKKINSNSFIPAKTIPENSNLGNITRLFFQDRLENCNLELYNGFTSFLAPCALSRLITQKLNLVVKRFDINNPENNNVFFSFISFSSLYYLIFLLLKKFNGGFL